MDRNRQLFAISGLLQVLAVVLGFVALGIVMKFDGYPDETFVRWNPLARMLREYGGWFFAAPITWLSVSVVMAHRAGREEPSNFSIVAGFVITVILLFLFIYAALNPFTRPLLFDTGSNEDTTTSSESASH